MGNIPKKSAYSWDQIEKTISNLPPKPINGYWHRWDIATSQWVNTGEAADTASAAAEAKASADAASNSALQAKTAAQSAATEAAETAAKEAATETAAKIEAAMRGYTDEAESYAHGGTGTRTGEDTDNAEYWASVAMQQADRASVPPVEGVYNLVVTDRITGEKYAIIVADGRLTLLACSANADTANLQLVDVDTGIAYALTAESGRIVLEEV